jgi:ADP-L-glycero-D-manno-heptose 6-epimerase
MIVVTGAAGFIGSNLIARLNRIGITDLILVDHNVNTSIQHNNLMDLDYIEYYNNPDEFLDWFYNNYKEIDFIFHLGARTDTMETRADIIIPLNYMYSKKLMSVCWKYNVPILYASSAATYGDGSLGYDDDIHPSELKPLNIYGRSKNEFDMSVLNLQRIKKRPDNWYGLKFFNVFGNNEQHKGRMASVIHHGINQVNKEGRLKLFKSNDPQINDGEQKRDFIYINDVTNICTWFFEQRPTSGIYNVGTGEARTFNDLAVTIFDAVRKDVNIEYIDVPEVLEGRYQNFTEANIDKLRNAGYKVPFYTLEDAVKEYFENTFVPFT